jgi:CxxC motif-containing protein (DUF1111 family)
MRALAWPTAVHAGVPGLAAAPLVLALLAGACTEPIDVAGTPGQALPRLTEIETGRFLLGKAVFERLVVPDEGLGPLFNAERCSACHDVPATGGSGVLLVKKATRYEDGRCDLLEAEGGDNIQQRATPALAAHGITAERVPASANAVSNVTAPALFGLGLLEAVPEAALVTAADSADADGDGVSGRVGRSADGRIGRFGRKAEIVTILDFVDTALRFEVGLTTDLHPIEEGPNGEALPADTDLMPEPEIDRRGLELLSEFIAYLASPERELATGEAADSIARGESHFMDVGCAACHSPVLRTGTSDVVALDDRTFTPWTDLLLHDLGPGLTGVCGLNASPSEWRTAPLWGLRYRTRLLYDGRAANPREAILQHGGEAKAAVDAFNRLTAMQQSELLRFLASL